MHDAVSAPVKRWSPGRAGSRFTTALQPISPSNLCSTSHTVAVSPPPTLYVSPGVASSAATVASTQSPT